jgi:hypothetical protein
LRLLCAPISNAPFGIGLIYADIQGLFLYFLLVNGCNIVL